MHRFFYRTLLALGSLLALGALTLAYFLYFSPYAWAGRRNWHNSYRVQPGMSVAQARRIMGPPTKQLAPFEGQSVYEYHYLPGASEEIYLSVNPDSTVAHISHGE